MAEQCPLCGAWSAVITPSIALCSAERCDVLTYRMDRPDDKTIQEAVDAFSGP